MTHVHICDFTTVRDVEVEYDGKKYRFDFAERFGPLFLNKNGVPYNKQPSRNDSPRMKAFFNWHENYLKAKQSAAASPHEVKP